MFRTSSFNKKRTPWPVFSCEYCKHSEINLFYKNKKHTDECFLTYATNKSSKKIGIFDKHINTWVLLKRNLHWDLVSRKKKIYIRSCFSSDLILYICYKTMKNEWKVLHENVIMEVLLASCRKYKRSSSMLKTEHKPFPFKLTIIGLINCRKSKQISAFFTKNVLLSKVALAAAKVETQI